jgi:hypothetical protein
VVAIADDSVGSENAVAGSRDFFEMSTCRETES